MNIEIRQATQADASFVARGVVMALHLDPEKEDIAHITYICAREDVLYSWRHTLIAFDGEQPVGLCLCYDGRDYHDTRIRTFQLFSEIPDDEDKDDKNLDLEHMEDETGPGEFYVDSLAVLPEYRRQGIARKLLLSQLERGRELGLPKATLLVDPDNPNAQALYRQCGFVHDCEVYAFGQIFWKWKRPL